jgi:N-sulfoglucosamine sulfohydrolase
MRESGYVTANIRQFPSSVGFAGTGKTDWNFTTDGNPFDYESWDDLKAHRPFLAQVNFQETHRPFRAPKRAEPSKVVIPPYYPDHPVTRQDWAAYLDSASELDRKVGLILGQLETDGLADTTIVVFMGDHGQAHVRGKQFCYEEGLHIPLIIAWPKAIPAPVGFRAGAVDDRLVEAIDLAPTFLSIAGRTKPQGMQGRILFGDRADRDREYAFGARDRCDETVFRLRTVRDARYRYIRNFTPDRPFLQANEYRNAAIQSGICSRSSTPRANSRRLRSHSQRQRCRPRNSMTSKPTHTRSGISPDPIIQSTGRRSSGCGKCSHNGSRRPTTREGSRSRPWSPLPKGQPGRSPTPTRA